MNKHILFLFLFSFSTSAFALFPIENDWAKHHLQGKVKSIKSKEEGNSALPDNGSVSYLDAFYNEQGFLIKEKEQGVLFDKKKSQFVTISMMLRIDYWKFKMTM